jgi:DNA-binding MarR family transcriptional regulator
MTIAELEQAMLDLRRAELTLAALGPDFPTPTQVIALSIIKKTVGCRAGEVAKQLEVTPAVITGLVDRLERNGLVDRVPSEQDRRAIVLGVTNKGEQALRKARTAIKKIELFAIDDEQDEPEEVPAGDVSPE